ncbi:UDP-N-acetylmuramoyl-L-alanyl-D-glutamate--2,6-diaminopimelate ligase [Thalassobacillus devorans]|uniref:UDP-N-acetylmuramoyl-L-alanyl-D-glutamate--2, 6-diaminopimelate ligase n=1 Tax=Thalassobacillus devorans TaxID=279813 RepID=UPI00048FC84D|nr:UDP-N-acetylmuramoyl-L-alanyl-D-glutamate--2,6-diaminopimelate ligase [Thalassobacillus devorans]
MKLPELLRHIPNFQTNKSLKDIEITGVEMDSRNVKEGDLFICLPGDHFDGHDFASQAVKQGAAALICERPLDVSIPYIVVPDTNRAMGSIANTFYQYPTTSMQLIGITGTNGKTSVSYLLEEIFQMNRHQTGLIGTIQMKINESVYPVRNTTPDSLFLQKSFQEMKERNVDTAIMEVSSHALDKGRVHGCDFDVAVFTNLSQDHLDYHGNMDEYLHAKSLLFAQLGNTFNPENPKFAIINADDPAADVMIRSTAQPVLSYGIQKEAAIMADHLHLHEKGTTFTLTTPEGGITINSSLMGKFNVYNMLAAAGAAIASGVELDVIKQALESTKGVRGRFEPVEEGQSFGIVIDYAHTPDSLHNVLQTMQEFCRGKVRVVVGCGGDRDRTKRPLMADVAMEFGDHAIFTSDNPRTESPEQILDDMVEHLEAGGYDRIVDRKEAIRFALEQAQPGDMVLIAGKGHETYQEVNGKRYEFDDRETARELLKQLKESK